MQIRSSLPPQAYTYRAIENRIRYWWQSRGVANGVIPPLFELADLPALAYSIRRTWGHNERTA